MLEEATHPIASFNVAFAALLLAEPSWSNIIASKCTGNRSPTEPASYEDRKRALGCTKGSSPKTWTSKLSTRQLCTCLAPSQLYILQVHIIMPINLPTLILRFRDLVTPTPGHTVAEHNTISSAFGYTWWGWWRKQSEPIPVELWSALRTRLQHGMIRIFLLDSGQKKLYEADLIDIYFEPGRDLVPAPEGGSKTPDYYQQISKPAPFASWFKIGTITEASEQKIRNYCYDSLPHDPFVSVTPDRIIGKRVTGISQLLIFGNVTYWVVHEAADDTGDAGPFYTQIPPDVAPYDVINALSPRILHISDLHLSTEHHAFATAKPDDQNVSLAHAIVSALGDKKPGFVLVTGDLTWSGGKNEFELARYCLDSLRSSFGLTNQHFLIIPGNHDLGWIRKEEAGQWKGEYQLASQDAKANYKMFLEDWYKTKFADDLSIGRRIFVHGGGTLDILGLNTSSLQQVEEHFAGLGRIPSLTFKRAAHRFGWDAPLRATQFRWLAVHHHVLPVVAQEDPGGASRGFGIALDAGSQLMNCGHYGVDLVLHGHQHHPYAGYINTLEISDDSKSDKGIHVLGAGSAGVVDKHLGPIRHRTFNLVDLSSGHLVVFVYTTERDAKEFRISYRFRDTPTGWKKEN